MNKLLIGLLGLLLMLSTSCTKYQGTGALQLVKDLDLPFTIVEDIPGKANGLYVHSDDMIYLEMGQESPGLVLHEAVHALRKDIWTDDRSEEIIACIAAYKIAKKAKMNIALSRYNLSRWINATLEVNGMEPRRLTDKESLNITVEVQKTLDMVDAKLKTKGKSLGDIDYKKTIIMLLL